MAFSVLIHFHSLDALFGAISDDLLLQGVRGANRQPGEFRTDSRTGLEIQEQQMRTAHFVPPSPTDMNRALDELETFIHEGK